MMENGVMEKFDGCFANMGVQLDDLLRMTGWFCVAQWVIRFSNGRVLASDEFDRLISSSKFCSVVKHSELDGYPVTQKADQLRKLVLLVQESGYVRGKAKIFFADYIPCAIADRSFFAESDSDRLGGASQCTLVYLSILYAGESMGSNAIHAVQAANVFEAHKGNFDALGLTFSDFECVWEAVHSFSVRGEIEHRAKINEVLAVYRKYKIPAAILLDHYARINNVGVENLKGSFNPWEDVQLRLDGTCPERGLTTEEEIFNYKAFGISKERPTDIVQTLFYKNRDDSGIEIALVRTEVKMRVKKATKVLIVNPSPAFLEEYCLLDDNHGVITRETVFAVTDKTVCQVYAFQFSEPYRFIAIPELETLEESFDYIVIMARDLETEPLWKAFELCKEGGSLTLFIPQSELTNTQSTLLKAMSMECISADWIMDVPACICQSQPKKKAIISAHKSSGCINDWVNLVFNICSADKRWLVPEKKVIRVPVDLLWRNMSLRQMRGVISKGNAVPHQRQCREYQFSREIRLAYYLIYGKSGKLEKARAYYRNIHRVDQRNRRMGTRPNDIRTERGLRAKTPEQIMKKLEGVALYDEFYDCIVDDVLDFYRDDLSRLSLKTLWFCCRKMLYSCVSYNDEFAMELFCRESQRISDVPVSDCSEKSIRDAIEADAVEGFGTQLWSLLYLIFKVAVENGLAEKNPFASMLSVVRQKYREGLYQLNANLKKSSFTDEEERRLVDWLMEEIPMPTRLLNAYSKLSVQKLKAEPLALPRCVMESEWLLGAFSLFTGLPLREVCPLCWGDLHEIGSVGGMQVYITKHLNKANQVVSNLFYAHQDHYRRVPLASVLSNFLCLRKRFLTEVYGISEDELESKPIFLEKEPCGRIRRKMDMISRKHAQQAKRQLLEVAKIEPDVISLLEGGARFDVDLNATKNDLFAANFREKATHICGFTAGELCHYTGTQASDTFERHYCDYNNDFLQYAMAKKLNRWWYVYDYFCDTSKPCCNEQDVEAGAEFAVGGFTYGRAKAELNLKLPAADDGFVEVEIDCSHGAESKVLCFGEQQNY